MASDGDWRWALAGAAGGGAIGGASFNMNTARYDVGTLSESVFRSIAFNPEGFSTVANLTVSTARVVLNSLDNRPPKVNLSGTSDEIFHGVVNWFNWLYGEGPFIKQPNDGRGTNWYNVNEIVKNPPPGFIPLDKTQIGRIRSKTSNGIRFALSIQPASFNQTNNYRNTYLTGMRKSPDPVGDFGYIWIEGIGSTKNHFVIQLKIHGLKNYEAVGKRVFKSYW